MKIAFVLPLAMALAAVHGSGQCFKMDINDKEDGQALSAIGQESDEAKKLTLLESFVAQYPKSVAAGWAYEQMPALYLKANNPDKSLEAAGKVMELDPACVEVAHQGLKAAEAKKDADLIKTWSNRTAESAAKVVGSAKPADADEAETWAKRVDWAKQVSTYADYSLYAAALQNPDPAKRVMLFEALAERNPNSEYVPKAYAQWFLAYRQAGQNDKALALAERVLEKEQTDPDMLLVVAGDYLSKKKDPAKVHAYTAKVVQIMEGSPKPEGMADADWQKRRGSMLGIAHFMSGSLYYAQSNWAQSDKELRAAVPHLDNPQVKAEALYYLGFSNYKLEKAQEAANYYRECAAIKSRFQAVAARNLQGVKNAYRGIK